MKRVYYNTRSADSKADVKQEEQNSSPRGGCNKDSNECGESSKKFRSNNNNRKNKKSLKKVKGKQQKDLKLKINKSTSKESHGSQKDVVKRSSQTLTTDHAGTLQMTSQGKSSSELESTNMDCGNKIQHAPRHVYSEVYTKEYATADYKQLELDFYPNVISEINDTIWCGGQSIINVFSKTGNLLSIVTDDIIGVHDIVKANDKQVIVACGNGLHQIELISNSQPGEYQALLTLGTFSGACIFEESLYAVEYNKGRIMVFKQKKNKWKHVSNIKINHSYRTRFGKLFIHDGLICIGSNSNQYMQVYNLQGEEQHQMVQLSNKFKGIHLSGIDQAGNLLLTNFWRGDLKVFDIRGFWHGLKLFEEPRQGLSDAVVDTEGNIWVAYHSKELFKFTPKLQYY